MGGWADMNERARIAFRQRTGSIAQLLGERTPTASRDHRRENVRRLRDLDKQLCLKRAQASQPAEPLFKLRQFENVPSRVHDASSRWRPGQPVGRQEDATSEEATPPRPARSASTPVISPCKVHASRASFRRSPASPQTGPDGYQSRSPWAKAPPRPCCDALPFGGAGAVSRNNSVGNRHAAPRLSKAPRGDQEVPRPSAAAARSFSNRRPAAAGARPTSAGMLSATQAASSIKLGSCKQVPAPAASGAGRHGPQLRSAERPRSAPPRTLHSYRVPLLPDWWGAGDGFAAEATAFPAELMTETRSLGDCGTEPVLGVRPLPRL